MLTARLGTTVLFIEIVIAHHQQENALNETKDCRDECPAEQQIHDAPSNTAEIKLVNTYAAQKKSE